MCSDSTLLTSVFNSILKEAVFPPYSDNFICKLLIAQEIVSVIHTVHFFCPLAISLYMPKFCVEICVCICVSLHLSVCAHVCLCVRQQLEGIYFLSLMWGPGSQAQVPQTWLQIFFSNESLLGTHLMFYKAFVQDLRTWFDG